MALNPEKNDVDISALFDWGDRFTIYDRGGKEKITYYGRLIGDADINISRVFALRKSAELRRKLVDKESDERRAYITEYDLIDEERLVESIVYLTMRDITVRAIKEVNIPYPKELSSDATLEQQEKYQAEVDEWPVVREKKIREFMEREVDKLRKQLQSYGKDRLYKIYEDSAINELCENEMSLKFKHMCVFLGSYKDEGYKERLFNDFNSFDNLPTEFKNQFVTNYSTLELGIEDLKK